jgi:type II secretory pathway pseudopilin PulG
MSARRSPARGGMTLIELALELALLVMILAMVTPVLAAQARTARAGALTAEGGALDAACDQVRAGLRADARLDGDDLIVAGARWHHDDTRLYRDGALRVSECAVGWRREGAWWVVEFAPRHGPRRTVTVWAGGPP